MRLAQTESGKKAGYVPCRTALGICWLGRLDSHAADAPCRNRLGVTASGCVRTALRLIALSPATSSKCSRRRRRSRFERAGKAFQPNIRRGRGTRGQGRHASGTIATPRPQLGSPATLLRETQRCTVSSVGTPDGTQGGRNCRGESALDFANHKISGALRRVLNQTAHAAARKKGSYFQAVFRRLLPRLGYKSAIWAIAHRLCRVVWKILHEGVRFASFSTTTPVIDSYPA